MDNIKRSLKIFCDSKSVVLYSITKEIFWKFKAIDIKFLVLKEVFRVVVSIEHIGTNSIITNSLTKDLSPKVFHEHITYIGEVLSDNVLV